MASGSGTRAPAIRHARLIHVIALGRQTLGKRGAAHDRDGADNEYFLHRASFLAVFHVPSTPGADRAFLVGRQGNVGATNDNYTQVLPDGGLERAVGSLSEGGAFGGSGWNIPSIVLASVKGGFDLQCITVGSITQSRRRCHIDDFTNKICQRLTEKIGHRIAPAEISHLLTVWG